MRLPCINRGFHVVFHLEIQLGYQHRGVERALLGGPDKRTLHYMETLAGDTSIGHATAYCQAVEALARLMMRNGMLEDAVYFYTKLGRDFEKLLAERQTADAKTTAHVPLKPISAKPQPPTAKLNPPMPAVPGRDLAISAQVTAPAGLMSVTLRYRHVTQVEDYQTAEMKLDPKTRTYVGSIPASFIDTKWNLMYFVEAIGRNGAGRMFPDLEAGAPYVIVKVRR